jgi:site-specific recombinase XerD
LSYFLLTTFRPHQIKKQGRVIFKTARSRRPRDIEQFKNTRLNTPVQIEIKTFVKELNPATKRIKTKVVKQTRFTPRKLASVHRELSTLRRMLNYAVNQGWLLNNPFSRTENLISNASERAREKVLNYEEEARLLAECDGENFLTALVYEPTIYETVRFLLAARGARSAPHRDYHLTPKKRVTKL